MQRPWSGAEWQSASHISFVYSHMMGDLSPKARSPTQRLTKSSEGWAKAAVPRLSYYTRITRANRKRGSQLRAPGIGFPALAAPFQTVQSGEVEGS